MQIFLFQDGEYRASPLGGPLALRADGAVVPVPDDANVLAHLNDPSGAAQPAKARGCIIPIQNDANGNKAVLLAPQQGVRLNGRDPLPIAVLRRGDEIRWDGNGVFFTDEGPLRAVPFVPAEPQRDMKCARCHRKLEPGEPVVHCPVCGTIYMAQADKAPNCWNFGPCIHCKRNPRAEFVWHPYEKHASRSRSWRNRRTQRIDQRNSATIATATPNQEPSGETD